MPPDECFGVHSLNVNNLPQGLIDLGTFVY